MKPRSFRLWTWKCAQSKQWTAPIGRLCAENLKRCGMRNYAENWIPDNVMRKFLILIVSLLTGACGLMAETGSGVWHSKPEFLAALVRAVPQILKTQDTATGIFGT